MKLRDRIVVNYKDATKKDVAEHTNTTNTTSTIKPKPNIARRRKSSASATVAARAIERMKLLKFSNQPMGAPSGLKIRLRRDVPVVPPSTPVATEEPSRRIIKNTKVSAFSPITLTNRDLTEVADILASFIAEGSHMSKPRSSIRLSAPPSLSGIPTLALQIPEAIKEEIVAAGQLTCHSPPFSPCESSPASSSPVSSSPPSSPRHESCPSSPPFEVNKERVPVMEQQQQQQQRPKDKGVKRKRTRTTQSQLTVLEAIFEEDKTPCKARRDEIGAQLNMTSRSVQVWFQNRRSKMKKLGLHKPEPIVLPTPSAAQEAVQKVLAPLAGRPAPPALPVFIPIPGTVASSPSSSPLPLPQIQSVESLLPPPSILRKARTPSPVQEHQQPSQQQVFILPKMPLPPVATPTSTSSKPTTTTPTTQPIRKAKRLAKRAKLSSTAEKKTKSKPVAMEVKEEQEEQEEEEVKPLEVVVATPVAVQPTLAPRPIKVVRKSHTDFSRATLVPVSARN